MATLTSTGFQVSFSSNWSMNATRSEARCQLMASASHRRQPVNFIGRLLDFWALAKKLLFPSLCRFSTGRLTA